jgi:predicted TIM-barrel fold metal-dependent hydrolase
MGGPGMTPPPGPDGPPLPDTPIDFEVPKGACDCHVHVIPPPARFPFAPDRVYTPPEASVDDLLTLQRRLHLERVVIVTPSIYGTDNGATLHGLRTLGSGRARGVAVLDDKIPAASLDEMAAAGVRAVRVNLETVGESDPETAAAKLRRAAEQAQPRGWHVEVYTRPSVIAALSKALAALPVPFVLDHFGGAPAGLGPEQPGFADIVALMRSGKAYVKLSGSYRSSSRAPDYPDVTPLAQALIAANPDRLLWGSDWPHPDAERRRGHRPQDVTPYYPIDDGRLLNLLPRWTRDAATRRKILVDNPARLYGF